MKRICLLQYDTETDFCFLPKSDFCKNCANVNMRPYLGTAGSNEVGFFIILSVILFYILLFSCLIFRQYTVHEVISMLEDDVDFQEATIAIDPPDDGGFNTDEDSGEEDGGGTISNLNRQQLMAEATVTVLRQGAREHLDFSDSVSL